MFFASKCRDSQLRNKLYTLWFTPNMSIFGYIFGKFKYFSCHPLFMLLLTWENYFTRPVALDTFGEKKVQLSHRRDFANYKLVRYPVFFFNFFLLKPIIILLMENSIRFVDWFIIMIQFLISLGSTVTTNQKHLK